MSRVLKVVSEQPPTAELHAASVRTCCTRAAQTCANAVSNTRRKQQGAHQNDRGSRGRYKPTGISGNRDLESVKLTSQYRNIPQMWWSNDITLYCDNQKLPHVHSQTDIHIYIKYRHIYTHIFICGGVYMYFIDIYKINALCMSKMHAHIHLCTYVCAFMSRQRSASTQQVLIPGSPSGRSW